MRVLFALIYNLVLLIAELLALPFRLLQRRKSIYLAVELKGDLPWRGSGARGSRLRPASRSPFAPRSLRWLAERLEEAGRDRRVRAVAIKLEQFEGAGAKLAQVRRMVERLREQGKEVVFYGRAVTMREYALMTSGSKLQLAPGGRVDLKGLAAELVVLGRTLGKAGIRAEFLRRGSHKTAPEMFTDAEVSAIQLETTREILSELFEAMVADIARGRGRSEAEVREWVEQGPYSAGRALSSGLVDRLGDGEDLEEVFAGSGKKPQAVPVAQYRGPGLFRGRYRPLRARPQVAVVSISGVIKVGESVQMPFAPRAAGSDSVIQLLRRARENRRVKAVVLHVDSRGGSSLASELILQAVRRLAAKKPVVACLDRIAASGGYMAAVGATHIVAAPGAIAGSIGVFGGKFEVSGLLDLLGVGRAMVRFGQNAALESGFSPWTDSERAALDREIEETYQSFLKIVAEGRKTTVEKIEPLAAGRIYTGRRAHEVGLVDEVGGFEEAVARAASLAGLPPEPEVVAYATPSHPLRALAGIKSLERGVAELRSLARERVFAAAPWWPSGDL